MSVAVLQDLWTAIGFTAKRALARHVIVAILVAGLVFGFAAVHAEWSPMHRWNRAFGDASLILIALAISLGPLTRFLRSVTRLLPFRRELGIQACLLVIVHAAIILVVWVELDLMRLFGFEWHPDLLIYVMFQHGFGLGNAVGLAAFALAILLAATWFLGLVLFVIILRAAAFLRTAGRTRETPSTREGYVRAPS